jgi:hypothetical protein
MVGTGGWKSDAFIYSKTVLPIGTHTRTPRRASLQAIKNSPSEGRSDLLVVSVATSADD